MPQTIPLWPKGAVPHSLGDAPDDVPTLTIHRPRRAATGLCIVCPGGGYHVHASHEAEPVANRSSRWRGRTPTAAHGRIF